MLSCDLYLEYLSVLSTVTQSGVRPQIYLCSSGSHTTAAENLFIANCKGRQRDPTLQVLKIGTIYLSVRFAADPISLRRQGTLALSFICRGLKY